MRLIDPTKNYTVRKLRLDARDCTKIENEHYHELSPDYEKMISVDAEAYCKDYAGKVRCFRVRVSAFYNCHGLTFANRRTCIHDANVVRLIIERDGYRKIDVFRDPIIPGDIVLYVAADNDIEHSGIVVGVGEKQPPLIISKWGTGPEVVHSVDRCPYDATRIEYYRVTT
jgi:hypothetical protein